MARSSSHFSHFGSSTHKMACQSAVRLSDAKLWICNNEPSSQSISCETFLSPRSGTADSQRGQPGKKNAKAKDTGGVKYIALARETRRLPPMLELSYVFIQVAERRRSSLRSALNNARSDNDAASTITRTRKERMRDVSNLLNIN